MTIEKIVYILEQAPEKPPTKDAFQEVYAKYDKHVDDDCQAKCYIFASMNEELQKQHEHMMHAADMISHLQEIYREGTRNKRFSAVCELLKMKMVKGAPVHQHRLKMIGLTKQLESLNSPLDCNLATNFFLASISDSFSHFVMNYNMGKIEHTLSELLNITKGKGKFNVSKKKKWNPKLKPKGGVKKKQEEGRGERIVFPLWERRTLEKELPGLLS
ncbi:unnamed protein product [Prunus armeniaca]